MVDLRYFKKKTFIQLFQSCLNLITLITNREIYRNNTKNYPLERDRGIVCKADNKYYTQRPHFAVHRAFNGGRGGCLGFCHIYLFPGAHSQTFLQNIYCALDTEPKF